VNFKIGDRVSFLNEKGGGIISKILDDGVVQVTIEDGFDIPVMITNLINTGSKEISDDIEKAFKRLHPQAEPEPVDEGITPLYLAHNNPDQRPDGIYFVMVPDIAETPLVGSLELFLVNHTGYHILFSIFESQGGGFLGTEYGFLEPESKLSIKSIGRSELEHWANALLQCVFFKDGKTTPVAPFSGLIEFKPIKLYKEESFRYESLFRDKAFFTEVCKLSDQLRKPLFEEIVSKESIRILQEKMQSNRGLNKTGPTKSSMLDKHKIDDTIAEVDLHIGELVDNFTNLEKGDLLQIQLEYFDKCMTEAEKEKISKIIFIHGVGNGKLKTEIYHRLQIMGGVEFYDASYARYGMGATEVNFYRNKS
jgi:hypothetical protein